MLPSGLSAGQPGLDSFRAIAQHSPCQAATELDQALGGLVLARLGDPGNTGTLIRTAAAFGIRQVLLYGKHAAYGPKAVRPRPARWHAAPSIA